MALKLLQMFYHPLKLHPAKTEIREAMVKMAMASFTPIFYFAEMTLDEMGEWTEVIADVKKKG